MKGKREFTRAERDQIRRLIAEKLASDGDGQKKVRGQMRSLGFHIRDWTASPEAFTVADLDSLIASEQITITPEPLSFGSGIDLSILHDDAAPVKGAEDSTRGKARHVEHAFTEKWLREEGFVGFDSFSTLLTDGFGHIPATGGLYVVVRNETTPLAFLDVSAGGRFKDKDPTVAVDILHAKWIDGCPCLYIGKGDNLRRRIREYATYGTGKPVGHQGGRYIWQLVGSGALLVGWKETPGQVPREAEVALMAKFADDFDRALPFANLVG